MTNKLTTFERLRAKPARDLTISNMIYLNAFKLLNSGAPRDACINDTARAFKVGTFTASIQVNAAYTDHYDLINDLLKISGVELAGTHFCITDFDEFAEHLTDENTALFKYYSTNELEAIYTAVNVAYMFDDLDEMDAAAARCDKLIKRLDDILHF